MNMIIKYSLNIPDQKQLTTHNHKIIFKYKKIANDSKKKRNINTKSYI